MLEGETGKSSAKPTTETDAGNTEQEVKKESLVSPRVEITPVPIEEDAAQKGKAAESTLTLDKGVGFDLDKIRETIANDDGTGQLPMPTVSSSAKAENGQRQSADEVRPPTPSNAPKGKSLFGRLRSKPDLNRRGSAPVPSANAQLPNGKSAEEIQYEAQQRMLEEQERREEEAFRKGLPVTPVYPAADNPFAASSASLPGLPSTQPASFSDGFGFSNGGHQATALSFGGIDGSISFPSDELSWQNSSSTDSNNAWKDPWQTGSGNAWSSSSKW